ncbi:CYTH domain-containing protein [Caulobacter sp. KR2-114]|uniref:CYTH domain-containing protein n=1 Tax=Caulobacter sp. KR2-114 TaxID=3400912 RepID=UPI003C039CC7
MAIEVERRFLVVGEAWRAQAGEPERIVQGYVTHAAGVVVRIRKVGGAAFVTLKGARQGPARTEFEYPIPASDADAMLGELCVGPIVEKDRYHVEHDGRPWIVDVYRGDAEGMVIAEVELDDPRQIVSPPAWAGREVTGAPQYSNRAIAAATARNAA